MGMLFLNLHIRRKFLLEDSLREVCVFAINSNKFQACLKNGKDSWIKKCRELVAEGCMGELDYERLGLKLHKAILVY